jgi:hypothetical protein
MTRTARDATSSNLLALVALADPLRSLSCLLPSPLRSLRPLEVTFAAGHSRTVRMQRPSFSPSSLRLVSNICPSTLPFGIRIRESLWPLLRQFCPRNPSCQPPPSRNHTHQPGLLLLDIRNLPFHTATHKASTTTTSTTITTTTNHLLRPTHTRPSSLPHTSSRAQFRPTTVRQNPRRNHLHPTSLLETLSVLLHCTVSLHPTEPP